MRSAMLLTINALNMSKSETQSRWQSPKRAIGSEQKEQSSRRRFQSWFAIVSAKSGCQSNANKASSPRHCPRRRLRRASARDCATMFPSLTLLASASKDIVSQPFKRAQLGLFHGKMRRSGNNVPFSKNKTRRTWYPNIQNKSFFSNALGRDIEVKVTTRALKTIKKVRSGHDTSSANLMLLCRSVWRIGPVRPQDQVRPPGARRHAHTNASQG